MKFIKQHKQMIIIISICVILLTLIGFTIYKTLVYDGNLYGNRLDEIEEVDNSSLAKIKDELINNYSINDVKYETNVKIVKFIIDTDMTSDEVKELGDVILNNMSEKIINSYDIEVYVTKNDDNDFPMIGYHSKSSTMFNWVLNKVVETNEE